MPPRISDRRLVFRFVAGALELGIDRLLAELRPADEPHVRVRRYQLVGALVAAPRSARAYCTRVISSAPLRLVRKTRLAERVRVLVNQTLTGWDELGRAELAAGRTVAEVGLGRIHAAVFERLAGPELAELVHEQSAGLTRGVVDDLRERSARADSRAEQLVRRLRRKRA